MAESAESPSQKQRTGGKRIAALFFLGLMLLAVCVAGLFHAIHRSPEQSFSSLGRVTVTVDKAPVYRDSKIILRASKGQSFDVTAIQGDWYGIQPVNGWIHEGNVVFMLNSERRHPGKQETEVKRIAPDKRPIYPSPIPAWLTAMTWMLEGKAKEAKVAMKEAKPLLPKVVLSGGKHWTVLSIDGKWRGTAPVEATLLPGLHLVRAIRGGQLLEHAVALHSGEKREISDEGFIPYDPIPYDPLGPSFEVPTEPKDAHGNPDREGTDPWSVLPSEIRHKPTGMHLVLVPAGKFMMGSPVNEKGRREDETQHRVTLTQPFYLGKYEVTQAEWKKVMGQNPSRFKGDHHPVKNVSWKDCQRFVKRLNMQTTISNSVFRFALPTEAQWEYACRAGATTRYTFGDNEDLLRDHAWYTSNSKEQTHPVGQKKPNAWAIYDMHGNVWEWCQDWYGAYPRGNVIGPTGSASGSSRVYRGGSWLSIAGNCRSADRAGFGPGDAYYDLGFRLALSPVQR